MSHTQRERSMPFGRRSPPFGRRFISFRRRSISFGRRSISRCSEGDIVQGSYGDLRNHHIYIYWFCHSCPCRDANSIPECFHRVIIVPYTRNKPPSWCTTCTVCYWQYMRYGLKKTTGKRLYSCFNLCSNGILSDSTHIRSIISISLIS